MNWFAHRTTTFSAACRVAALVGAFAFATPAVSQPSMPPNADRVYEAQTSPPPIAPNDVARTNGVDPGIHDLSPWAMFESADLLVKGVMSALAFASLVTWTIFLAKTIELGRARLRLGHALSRIEDSSSLQVARSALERHPSVLSTLLAAALEERSLSGNALHPEGIKERAASSFSEIMKAEAGGARRGMGLLATIGATAPFVGLFGTVWGIMNSFIGISKSQTTNLAVVAPGIAEALLATAMGLIAAIPAVVIYNHFSRQTRSYLDMVGRASGAAGRLLSRDLDREAVGNSLRAVV
jgi:biopolymer transport protein ExbB